VSGAPGLKLIASPPAAARRMSRRLLGFGRDTSGAMAVEFALVVAPLLFMLFAIIELALVFLVSSTLDNATTQTARTIRTGAVQTAGGSTATSIRNTICANLGWLQAQCQTNLSVDVRTFSQFTNPTIPDPVSNGVFNTGSLTYAPGAQGDIVLVRAFYRWKLITPFLNGGLQRLNNGVTMLTASATFRNEPY
jgi:Flp pilus assembly protein TadG